MLGEAEVAVPARDKDHVVSKVFALNLGLLEHYNVGFENVEHSLIEASAEVLLKDRQVNTDLESPSVPPWLVPERISGDH